MKVLVYEHISACWVDDAKVRASVFCEGFGMLKAFVMDAASAGHVVTTIINKEVAEFNSAISNRQVLVNSPVEAERAF